MKIKRKQLSLRWRITLLMGSMILLVALILTVMSMYNAQNQMVSLVNDPMFLWETTIVPDLEYAEEEIHISVKNASEGEEEVGTTPSASSVEAYPVSMSTQTAVVDHFQRGFNVWSLVIMGVVAVLGMGMTYWISGQALKPVRALNQAIKQTSEYNLSHRLPDPGSKDELGRLTHSFNGMLERLEESFQKQRRFSANVAHELKTPLATMKASAQVLELEETPTKEDYEETLQIMEHSTDRLIQVVDDLLLMNREEQEQNWEEVSLPEMFAGIVAEVKAAYPEKSCAVTLDLKREHVMGNASLIYRAFFNLVENAWKYNQSNGQIYISSETESGFGKIMIQDTGIGIPEDQLDLIFEPFYRVDLSRSRKIAGAGLGLSLVKEILQKHHWNIQVESSLRKGTIFCITIPAQADE